MNMTEAVKYGEPAKCVDRPGDCAEVIRWLIDQLNDADREVVGNLDDALLAMEKERDDYREQCRELEQQLEDEL